MALYEPRLTVFLSSSMAPKEFLAEREFLVYLFRQDARLDHEQLYAIEMWAHGTSPSNEYADKVLESDIMILLLGSELRPAVRREVQLAKEKGIPILAFQCTRYEPSSELEAFVTNELQQDVTLSKYAQLTELAENVIRSLRKLVMDIFKQSERLGTRVTREADGVLTTPEPVSLKLDAAMYRLSKGDISKAKPMFEEIVALDQENFEAHLQLAYILDNVPPYNHQKAVKHLRVATQVRPEDVGARFNLAVALIHAEEPIEAIEHFDFVEPKIDISVHRDAAVTLGKLYLFRAEARAKTGNPVQREAALKDLEKGEMLLQAADSPVARYWLGQIEDRRKYIDQHLTSS
jgi:Tfp pilus assembly protein PilF